MTRQGHQSKTREDRREYFRTTIRGAGPTMEDRAPIIDTTDTVTPEEKAALFISPTKKPSPVLEFLKERLFEMFITAVIIPLFLAGGYQLYSLNREVGEVKVELKNNMTSQEDIQSQIEKTEKRITEQIKDVSSDVEKLERRVDKLFEQNY